MHNKSYTQVLAVVNRLLNILQINCNFVLLENCLVASVNVKFSPLYSIWWYMTIIEDIVVHSHCGYTWLKTCSIFYTNVLMSTPVDSESKVTSYVLHLWSRFNLQFDSAVDGIINNPYTPKFVQVEEILEKFGHIEWEYWADRFAYMPDVLNEIARQLELRHETESARYRARKKNE